MLHSKGAVTQSLLQGLHFLLPLPSLEGLTPQGLPPAAPPAQLRGSDPAGALQLVTAASWLQGEGQRTLGFWFHTVHELSRHRKTSPQWVAGRTLESGKHTSHQTHEQIKLYPES